MKRFSPMTGDGGGSMFLLPPAAHLCQECAKDHANDDPPTPHDPLSLFYGVWFNLHHKRSPTWADAMAHCDDATKAMWTETLERDYDIDINSTHVRGKHARGVN